MSRRTPLLALTLALGACASNDGFFWNPLEGPKYDAETGLTFEPEPEQTFVVAATYLPVSRQGKGLFRERMGGIQAELDAGPEGLIAYSTGGKLVGREYRTVTIWETEDDMMQFVLGDAHAQAIVDGGDIRDPDKQARVVRWEITPEELPLEFADVQARTDDDGRQVLY
jgi:heme-degrading monooxygenase HmoA